MHRSATPALHPQGQLAVVVVQHCTHRVSWYLPGLGLQIIRGALELCGIHQPALVLTSGVTRTQLQSGTRQMPGNVGLHLIAGAVEGIPRSIIPIVFFALILDRRNFCKSTQSPMLNKNFSHWPGSISKHVPQDPVHIRRAVIAWLRLKNSCLT